jgi:hypothetical protein
MGKAQKHSKPDSYFLLLPSAHFQRYEFILCLTATMLGGSLVTMAWRVLRLRMEETPYSYGGKLQIY